MRVESLYGHKKGRDTIPNQLTEPGLIPSPNIIEHPVLNIPCTGLVYIGLTISYVRGLGLNGQLARTSKGPYKYTFICYLSMLFSIYLYLSLSLSLSPSLSPSLSIYLSICLSICLSVYLSVCLFIYLYTYSLRTIIP